jgi:fucokinase
MYLISQPWDYLVLTAPNERLAAFFEKQLRAREWLGLLHRFNRFLVVPDPQGKRIGSGGSTILCLQRVLEEEAAKRPDTSPDPVKTLSHVRILIIHAGGDSRRLPVYAHLGKVFIPVPGESDSALPLTLFDKQIEILQMLPGVAEGNGQIVITSGDVLLRLDPRQIEFADTGITFVAMRNTAEVCTKHGVYVCDDGGRLKRFLQKPSIEQMRAAGALDNANQGLLDIGLMSFDAVTAAALMSLGSLSSLKHGAAQELDLYREICCALGNDTTFTSYIAETRKSGTRLDETTLARVFDAAHGFITHVYCANPCEFLHFGTIPQLIESGRKLLGKGKTWLDIGNTFHRTRPIDPTLPIELQEARKNLTAANRTLEFLEDHIDQSPHEIPAPAEDVEDHEESISSESNCLESDSDLVTGGVAWIEGCSINSPIALGGMNVLTGANVKSKTVLPNRKGLDIVSVDIRDRGARNCVRLFDISDDYKRTVTEGITILGEDLAVFLGLAGVTASALWAAEIPASERTLWNAKLHPIEYQSSAQLSWSELLMPSHARETAWERWRLSERLSHQDVVNLARLVDHRTLESSWDVRRRVRDTKEAATLPDYSARDFAYFAYCKPGLDLRELEAVARCESKELSSARLFHVYGSLQVFLKDLVESNWLDLRHLFLTMTSRVNVPEGSIPAPHSLRMQAFNSIQSIVRDATSGRNASKKPTPAVKVRVTSPVRFDLAGGWTDTPPYTLERGGCVLNAAINLVGSAPIETRVQQIDKALVRIHSLDHSQTIEVSTTEQLLDYTQRFDAFSLGKAAVVLSTAGATKSPSFDEVIELLGGGIEITTHSRVPSGSGLGASSIVGATLVAALHRLMGREIAPRTLYFHVLQLEQMLTTGGGWQDQIGGVVGGVKFIETVPDLVPDPRIRPVSHEVLDPSTNGGCTLLYYTGLTRLAKNILQQVVGRYLDRDRAAMAALAEIRSLPPILEKAMNDRDMELFGRCIGAGWELKKRLDPGSTTPEIEMLFRRVKPHTFGATLLGAGGGGFMLCVCRSPRDAERVRDELTSKPPNASARFYDFAVNLEGMKMSLD